MWHTNPRDTAASLMEERKGKGKEQSKANEKGLLTYESSVAMSSPSVFIPVMLTESQ